MGKLDLLWNFAKKVDLANLKSEIDGLDIGKLQTTLVDLSKLSNVVKNKVLQKTVCDELVKKVNAIQVTHAGNLVKKADFNTKSAEIENKIDLDNGKYITTQEFNDLMAENFVAR